MAPRAKIREESLENAMVREGFKGMTSALSWYEPSAFPPFMLSGERSSSNRIPSSSTYARSEYRRFGVRPTFSQPCEVRAR